MKRPIFLFAAALSVAVPAAAASPIEGLWRNPKGTVTVRIAPCGPQYCGKVVAASAKARKDAAESGTRDLVGTTILSGMTPTGHNRWKGRVFLPKARRHATGTFRLTAPSRMTVHGCILGILCKDQNWTKVD